MKEFFKNIQETFFGINLFMKEMYLAVCIFISSFLAHYTDIKTAFWAFIIITILDTTTRINAEAVKKGLVFNPFKGYFWAEIKSGGLRDMCKKIFSEYFVYLIISFVIDILIFKQNFLIDFMDRKLTLPVIALYVFSAVELWSIGENIEDSGGTNIFKRVIHLLPEKVQKIVQPNNTKDGE
jgi:hypothetical protein